MPLDSWRLVIDSRAEKDLKALRRQHHPVLPSVVRAIDALAAQPLSGKPLKGDKRGAHSLRIGDFRVIYDLYPADRTVHIIRVGDRKEIYR